MTPGSADRSGGSGWLALAGRLAVLEARQDLLHGTLDRIPRVAAPGGPQSA